MKTRILTRMYSPKLAVALSAAALMISLNPAEAADRNWIGTGSNANFPNTGNWQDGIAPVSNLNDDRAVFAISPSGVHQPFLSSSRNINGLQFDTSGWSFTGGDGFTLIIGSGGIINAAGSGTNAISANLGVNGTQTWKSAAGGTLEIGTTQGAGALFIGDTNASGAGTVSLLGSSARTGNTQLLGGTLHLGSNTALGSSGFLRIAGDSSLTSSSALTVNNVLDIRNNLVVGGGGSFNFTGEVQLTTNNDRTLTVNNGSTTFSGGIIQDIGGRGLEVAGAGTTIFEGASNNYSGATTVSGNLLVNGTLGSSAVSVLNGGVLGGSGQITQSVTVSGVLAPGGASSLGTLATGALEIGSTGGFAVQLGRDGASALSDRVSVTGTLTLNNADLSLSLGGGLDAPELNDIYWLMLNDGSDTVSGSFASLNGVATDLNQGSTFFWNSQQWMISYEADFGAQSLLGGNDVAITVIPEPAAGVLAAGLLVGLLAVGRCLRASERA